MKTIEVTVRRDGSVRVETQGFRGETCRDASRFLEEALGKKTSENLTAEFYQAAVSRQQTERQ